MLITFTSKAAAEVTMYQIHAKRILDLLNKDATRGVITAAEAPHAVEVIEKEIAANRRHQTSEDTPHDFERHADADDPDHEGAEMVSFSARAFPLLEMLRAATKGGYDVLWGV